MKVRDVKINVLRVNIARETMSADLGHFGGETELGLLRILTDEGIEGNCFVGTFNHSGQLLVISLADRAVQVLGVTAKPDESWILQLGRNLIDTEVYGPISQAGARVGY